MNPLQKALLREIELQRHFFSEGDTIETIYFGGGTPSLLHPHFIEEVIGRLAACFTIESDPEITLEVNPDDISNAFLSDLSSTAVNRLSIGIQSFFDSHLTLMNRRHSADGAARALDMVRKAGYNNISLDLIYGIPGMTNEEWAQNIDRAIFYKPEHISAYHLTIEENTVFDAMLRDGKIMEEHEDVSFWQFEYLIDKLKLAGYNQYEISNFSLQGMESKHNSSYWSGKKYLGLGPSAHSFNLKHRYWNVSDMQGYMNGVMEGSNWYASEEISQKDKFNEYIMTALRTSKGLSVKFLVEHFQDFTDSDFFKQLDMYVSHGLLTQKDDFYSFTGGGFFQSDRIIAELFRL